MSLFSELSKEVGWEHEKVEYPTTKDVRDALTRHSHHDLFQLILWNRFLKTPESPKQVKIIKLISEGLANMRI